MNLFTLCYAKPPMKWGFHAIPIHWFYRYYYYASWLMMRVNPHTKRFIAPVRKALAGKLPESRISQICNDYLTQRRYLNSLQGAWPLLTPRNRPAIRVHGKAHVDKAIADGQGVVIVSPHNFGFERLVASILADRYPVTRIGGLRLALVEKCWGKTRPWEYLLLPKDPWGRLRAMKQLIRSATDCRIFHFMVINRREGHSQSRVDFYGNEFYLDSATFEIIAQLKIPALACFTVCDDKGAIDIIMDVALPADALTMAQAFAEHFAGFLQRHPEGIRFWKPLINQAEKW